MPTPISGQMRASMLAVTSLNDDITTAQTRLNTGRKVNTALDDPATYFKAQNYTTKSMAIDDVNKNIALAMSNVKVADAAMTTMLKNMNTQLSAMKDAKSVPVGLAGNAVSTTGRTTFAGTTDSLVSTTLDDANAFQNNDTIAISLTNSLGTTSTMNFKAVTTTTPTPAQDGTAAKPYVFNTIADLQARVQDAFGDDSLKLTMTGTGTNLQIRFNVIDPKTTLSIAQTSNGASAALSTAANNVYTDLASLFGASATQTQASYQNFGTAAAPNNVQSGYKVSYSPVAASTNQTSLDNRKAVADGYQTMLTQLQALVSDAYVPGLANLLNNTAGNTVNLNADGSTTQTIKLATSLDNASIGLAVGDTGTGVAANFANDPQVDVGINAVTKAIAIVTFAQKSLANQSTMLNNRSDFNKSLMNVMNGNADLLLSADTTTEAANLASMQTRQSFATNNMASTKQQESGLIQLLR